MVKRAETPGLEDYVPLTNALGNHVDVEIRRGDLLNDYQMRCSLGFGGVEEAGKEVKLQWDEPVWDPTETQNGLLMLIGNNMDERNLKRHTLVHGAQINSSISYTCRMLPANVGNFEGGLTPKECSIRFATEA